MITFKEMEYKRPDFDATLATINDCLKKVKEAKTEAEFFDALKKCETINRELDTMSTLCYIRHSIDTRDEFYSKEQDVMDENMPRFNESFVTLNRLILESPFRDAVEKKFGKHLLEKLELSLKTFIPEILDDLIEENKLTSQYSKLTASAEIEFEGKTYNLSGLAPFLQSTDRAMRKKASLASWGWMAEHEDELNEIYDQLVKVRDRIGKKMGYDNFIPVAYARMGRTDWDQESAKKYRQQIIDSVVPLAQKLYKEQAERIGIEDMKSYDYNLSYLSGNPQPQGEEAYLVKQAQEMYSELSPESKEFFDMMVDRQLMDLSTKPGKAPGGYCTSIIDYKVPFIFSNFNGTKGDVDVLTHEAGHAFQGYLDRDLEFMELGSYTSEVAEIHSMSMEFFTHPWMEKFFGEDCEKYYHSHVVDAIQFLPYGASVDAFQEWVYEHPEASPQERHAHYRELQKIYMPHLDYDGMPYLEKGARWQRQLHIYEVPFYYLDYTLSQICALQYFLWDRKDHEAAWNSYLKLCKRSGRVPFTKLLPEAGLKDPFKEGCIASITPELEEYLASLDHSKIK